MNKKIISVLLAFVMSVSMVLPVAATNIQDAKDKEQQLEEQRDNLAEEKASLSSRVRKITQSMKEAEASLEAKQAEIEEAEQQLIMAKLDESEQYESMRLRMKYTYENGNIGVLQLFLESESITDFITRAEYVSRMSDYDREKLEEFQRTVRKVEEKELVLQAEYEDVRTLQEQLSAQRAEAQALLNSKSSELSSIQSDLNEIRAQIARAEEAEKKKQEAENAAKEETNGGGTPAKPSEPEKNNDSSAENTSKPVVSGNATFTHPCPGMSYQSSYFGEVRYGIGDTRPHKGHDYAAPQGTPIYAAASGTVLIAGYSYSAGYWVVINHGNGLTSKYMHMYQRPLVSAGQSVSKGQQLGGVGTTGQSTGNHLHFQVEEYGVAVNPSKYM